MGLSLSCVRQAEPCELLSTFIIYRAYVHVSKGPSYFTVKTILFILEYT